MATRRVLALDREKVQKYRIKRGMRNLFRQRVQARMMALMAAAYSHWESQALDHWDQGTGYRYLEGLYFNPAAAFADIQIKVKTGTFAAMLESGYPSFSMFPAMMEAAFRKGGQVNIPMGDKGTYEGSVVDRSPILGPEELMSVVQRNDKLPTRAIDAIMTVMSDRGIHNTALGTKSLGRFTGGQPKFVSVSIKGPSASKPADLWKMRAYRGAKIADSVAYFVESNRDSYFADLFPASTTVDF